MKRILATILTTATVLAVAMPASASTAVPVGAVNLRSGPGLSYDVIAVLPDGQPATVVGKEGYWFKVRTSDGRVGYMADWVTRELFDDEEVFLQIDTDVLNLRTEPSTSAPIVGQVRQGEKYRLLEGVTEWYKIDAGSLGTGWIYAAYVKRLTPAPTAPPVPVTPPPVTPPATQPPGPVPPPDKTPIMPRPGLVKNLAAIQPTALRNGRHPDYDSNASVRAGETLTYLESTEGWVKAKNAAGVTGWVPGEHLNFRDPDVAFAYSPNYVMTENDWQIRNLKAREIVSGGAILRTDASVWADSKGAMQAGDPVKLLQVPPTEYVQVLLGNGATGWVSRNTLKPGPANLPTESVRLYQAATGILRVEVTGQTEQALVSGTENTLSISLPGNPLRRGALQVDTHGVSELELGQSEATVRFDQPFRYQVLERSATRTVIEIRPVVTKVERTSGLNGETYRIYATGAVLPVAWRSGGEVFISLQGALLENGAAMPPEFRFGMGERDLIGRVTSARSFAIKRGVGYVDLTLFTPGLSGKTIVVDPGHGGVETGAIGLAGLYEKELNLAIGLKLRAMLEAAGARVVMTRTADTRCASAADLERVPAAERLRYDLNCRTVIPNTAGADAFVSIHSNANGSRAERGTETYWSAGNLNAGQSRILAGLVQDELLKSLGLRDRGVREEMFYVIRFTDAPAVLAEVAFVSNAAEEALLKQDSTRQQAAESLFRALQRYFQ